MSPRLKKLARRWLRHLRAAVATLPAERRGRFEQELATLEALAGGGR